MIDPEPVTPFPPTATQSTVLAQETPVRSTELAGAGCDAHVLPLLVDPRTYGVEFRFVPTAKQELAIQLTALSDAPGGVVPADQWVSPFELTLVPVCCGDIPTATQFVADPQETAERIATAGSDKVDQVSSFWVANIAGSPLSRPIATHVVALGQDTLERSLVPVGGNCGFHVSPFTVETISLPSTAVHWSAVKHEMDAAGNDESSGDHEMPPSVDLKIP